ncbi:MurR/RpiR family transcriptional regulator [Vibrio sp. VB16]|uniref:MurR/RpiR family transcriptional regulator n=1 Tax=Vibrio sp. VB16 TaxID=2785746 RepID=UPI00189D1105|nr:MurR/RpiR family transcriptional regulator [Vibrio sp. VB16]UGA57697.1 MurR/RpiR family transcriptional regulator [Vibrio sp. VB16]
MQNENIIHRLTNTKVSPAERRLVEYLLSLSEYQLATLNTDEICQSAKASRATIGRLSKRFGCSGQRELRADIMKSSRAMKAQIESSQDSGPNLSVDDTPLDIAHKVFSNCSVRALRFSDILEQSDVLANTLKEINQANKIITFGVGQSAIAALDLYQRLLRIGLSIQFDLDSHTQLVKASLMGKNDLAIIISYSGVTREIVEVARIVKERGSRLLIVTAKADSSLSELADITVLTPPGTGLYGMDAAMNRMMQIMFNEVIYQCLVVDSPGRMVVTDQVNRALDRGKLLKETKRKKT